MNGEETPPILTLPIEIHQMIFDNMKQNDKVNFGRCSKKCHEIWKETRRFYEAMQWRHDFEHITLSLNDSHPFSGYSHFINFSSEHCESVKIGQTGAETEIQAIRGSKLYFEVARDLFKKKLEKNQNRIRSLTFHGECPMNFRKIKHFRKLQYFTAYVYDTAFIRELLPRTGNMLKYLKLHERALDSNVHLNLADFPEIYRVREYLSINFELTAEQMMNLSAKRIEMPAGKLKPQDIYNFIQTWQIGERNLENCVWTNVDFSLFRPFFQFYGVRFFFNWHIEDIQVCIRGIGDKSAKITMPKWTCMKFEVFDDEDLADENGA
ncbi:unnamed protein product [Caenorhabditis angaria]|uniref:F-box domain-containing protein n=1 Tax=Caenorhabditis angaria TaxID=860376 RepID=A0A9P1I8M3_9PELO|nr:unnamed protein product [Caenorhabditis angaria]